MATHPTDQEAVAVDGLSRSRGGVVGQAARGMSLSSRSCQ
jgi:hypothetical protein